MNHPSASTSSGGFCTRGRAGQGQPKSPSPAPFRFGDIVTYVNPTANEVGVRLRVIWVDRERCKVQELGTDLTIVPTAILDVVELRIAEPRDGRLALEHYVEINGATLKIGSKHLVVLGVSRDGDIAVGTFQAVRARNTGVMQPNCRIAGHPDCEVWCVTSGSRTIARFAIASGGALLLVS